MHICEVWTTLSVISPHPYAQYCLPSYYMQELFRRARGDSCLNSKLTLAAAATVSPTSLKATAVLRDSHLFIKAANYGPSTQPLTVSLSGFSSVSTFSDQFTLTSATGPDASNSLTIPTAVVPIASKATTGTSFSLVLPAWSVVVLDIEVA